MECGRIHVEFYEREAREEKIEELNGFLTVFFGLSFGTFVFLTN
jgi:hypothetical protein